MPDDAQVNTKHRGLRTVDGWIIGNSKWFEMIVANDKKKVEEDEGCAGKGHGRTMAMKVCVEDGGGQGCPDGLLFCYESRMKVAKRTAQFQLKFADDRKIMEKCNWAKLQNKTSEEDRPGGNETKQDGEDEQNTRRHGFWLRTKGNGDQMKLRIETTMADGGGDQGQVFSTPLSSDGCALFHFDAPSSVWSPFAKGSPSLSMGLLRNRTVLRSFWTLELFVLDMLMGVGLWEKEVLMVHQRSPNCRMRVTFHPGCAGKGKEQCLAGTNWADDGKSPKPAQPVTEQPNTGGGGNSTTTDPVGQ